MEVVPAHRRYFPSPILLLLGQYRCWRISENIIIIATITDSVTLEKNNELMNYIKNSDSGAAEWAAGAG